ncbi:metal ABC transporter substrate-binding protein [Facklamia sp. DSM 111018]|uniref:Metal ABC transporter substrate-binding protein n=1 Tax=Facklamia lactis TaxID=2749967 RepID=A0ABS0LQA9_9LACT|nr:metal ABC transporter substrate-binding protein [Facklamia lactis]MBG9980539.1 metal ABC transporter substrate-binding protein [Facklamia lactis]MBG9986331.1 metal ABC transporter substrate-binding protein [Facklamia lactis]
MKIKNKLLLMIGLLLAFGGLFVTKNQVFAEENQQEKLKIVTTYSILSDMVENIAGDKAEVYSMVPIGTDPHMYDPLPDDAQKVSEADLIFYNGFNLETGKGWFQDLLDVSEKNELAFAVTENVEPMYLTEEGKETEQDPHAWLDVQNGMKYVDLITEKLIAFDPDNEDYYQDNHNEYIKALEELDEYSKEKIATIPESQRVLVTSEGAFKYFSKAYGFHAAYIWEINTDSQGTPEQMEQILATIKEKDVQALFVETSVSPKTMETVSEESGVPIKGTIFTDSLAKKGTDGDTYIDMIKWNVDHIVEGLSE